MIEDGKNNSQFNYLLSIKFFKIMKTKFITSIIILSVCSLFIFLTSGCESETSNSSLTQEEQEIIEQYSYVGDEHNNLMSSIYNEFSSKTRSSCISLTKNGFAESVENATKRVFINNGVAIENIANVEKYFQIDTLTKTRSASLITNYSDSIIGIYASDQLKGLLNDLIEVSDNYNLSIERHKSQVNNLNKLAISTLDKKELGYFLAGSSTACASFEYWHNHLKEWCKLIATNTTSRLKSGEKDFWDPYGTDSTTVANNGVCEGMVGADVGGAVTGAITGGLAGSTAVGAGAVPGAVTGAVVGGVAASAGKVVENIINNLF